MTISLAVVQYAPIPGQYADNLSKTLALINQVGPQVDLVILPELALTGYYFRDRRDLAAHAEAIPRGPSIRSWVQASQKANVFIVAGIAEWSNGHSYNSAVVIGPTGVLGVYRKAHLHHVERGLFDPGDLGFPIVDLPFARLGLLICFDLRFVEASRVLMLKGTDLLCVPTTWSNLYKPDPYDERGWCMANYMAVATAYFNRYYVACADRVGGESSPLGPVRYLGASIIVDPYGKVLAGPASHTEEEVLTAELDLSRARDKRLGAGHLVADRRPEHYTSLATAVQELDGAHDPERDRSPHESSRG